MKLNCHEAQSLLCYELTEVRAVHVIVLFFFGKSFVRCVMAMSFRLN